MLHHNLEQEAEEYFRQLHNEYPLALKTYDNILSSLSALIKNNDYDNISCLIEYIEKGTVTTPSPISDQHTVC